jgi:hypothetical protein
VHVFGESLIYDVFGFVCYTRVKLNEYISNTVDSFACNGDDTN